jgi:hypothetical protein
MSTKLRLRASARFLASFFDGVGTKVRIDGLARYLDLDYTQFVELTNGLDAADSLIAIYNKATQVWNATTLGTILNTAQTQQIKTTAGDVTVMASDGLIAVNKGTGAATAVNFPLSSLKIGGCLVADFKGDAGTNNITINLTSPDVFPGGGSTWIIAANAGSVFLRPIPGIGYAL